MEKEYSENWQKFAFLARNYSSEYLTKEDRIQMIKDIFSAEFELEAAKDEIQNIYEKVQFLAISSKKDYPWHNFVELFSNRFKDEDEIDTVARDILLIERINKYFNKLTTFEIKEDFTSSDKFEMESFKLALFLFKEEIKKGRILKI